MNTLFRTRFLLAAALSAAVPQALLAQSQPAALPQAPPTTGTMPLSLQQAISYAVQNKSTLLATRLGEATATAKVGEIKSAGLPQVNVAATVSDNFKLQKSLVSFPLSQTVLTQSDLAAAQGGQQQVLGTQQLALPPQPFAFGLQYAGNASASVSQLLFDGSYLIGLKAAKVYTELAKKQTQQAEIDVVEQVSKAYYSTLVARSRLALLARNVQRLDTVLSQTNKTFKAGFAEKLDVDRLRVQRNNLVVEQQKAQRLTELSVGLLKFQMGLPQAQNVQLTDSLGAAVVDAGALRQRLGTASLTNGGGVDGLGAVPTAPTTPGTDNTAAQNRLDQQNALSGGLGSQARGAINYNNRIEFSTLETQQALAGLDLRNRQAGAYPRLVLTGAYGFTGSAPTAGDLFAFRGPSSRNSAGFVNQNWFGFGNVGLSLQVPVFDGFRRKYLVQQSRIQQQTIEKGFETLKQSIDLQDAQSRTTLINALDVLDNQKANLDLATDVARVTRIKFNAGVGSNLEVITAETDLRSAQTNYYGAVYDVLVAKVDRDKATGELYNQVKK
ncbi:TolC family protein [Hymenobacter negativus]|uniref:TolC family protein n=1 Tax=Hymenobacter negativus TaxID=2795026 RepID=A0ABS0Q866_9BACT|nr:MULTISPECIES: TolC family protein [Bacteria]MBH8558642.1 TolC family protein [Hymenobacter negativus]MBH8570180.1 TolC family protein [Hymenobacter negativus]MBR7209919.1 TolC family protein [Microvirga sp. STS02]